MSILLTRKEAAKELRVSTRTIDRLITNGLLRPTRIGRAVRIPVVQIQKFALGDHPVLRPQ
jgi:excisionase family DNA binding protein